MIPVLLAASASDPQPTPRSPGAEPQMSFLQHIDELRGAVWRAVAVAMILIVTAWFFSGRLLDALIYWLLKGQRVLALTPTEAFSARVEVALWTGGVLALPYVLFELWRFVAPGLRRTERLFAIPWLVASSALLYLGIAFALNLLLPMIVTMLQSFATEQVESRVSLLALLHFTVKMTAGCGLLFQMPLVLCLLAWFGIYSPRAIARQWRQAILFIALAAAVVTPGDGPSMLILSVPLIVLYFLSLVFAWAIWRARWKNRSEPGALG